MATKEKVKVTIPRAKGHEDPNLFVCINGMAYLIPKGKTSEVPPEVAYEIERARGAEEFFYEAADELKAKQQ